MKNNFKFKSRMKNILNFQLNESDYGKKNVQMDYLRGRCNRQAEFIFQLSLLI